MRFLIIFLPVALSFQHAVPSPPVRETAIRAAFFEEELPTNIPPAHSENLQRISFPLSPLSPPSVSNSPVTSNDFSHTSLASTTSKKRDQITKRRRFIGRGLAALASSGGVALSSDRANAFDPISFFAPYPAQAEGSSPIVYSDDSIMDNKVHGEKKVEKEEVEEAVGSADNDEGHPAVSSNPPPPLPPL
jgi:hypothetical protein